MDYILIEHARESLSKRLIRLEWLDLAISQPQRIEVDRLDSDLEHRLVRIHEYDDRVNFDVSNTTETNTTCP